VLHTSTTAVFCIKVCESSCAKAPIQRRSVKTVMPPLVRVVLPCVLPCIKLDPNCQSDSDEYFSLFRAVSKASKKRNNIDHSPLNRSNSPACINLCQSLSATDYSLWHYILVSIKSIWRQVGLLSIWLDQAAKVPVKFLNIDHILFVLYYVEWSSASTVVLILIFRLKKPKCLMERVLSFRGFLMA